MIKVEFIKDFATRKKGEITELETMLASDLVKRKVVKKVSKKGRPKKVNEPD